MFGFGKRKVKPSRADLTAAVTALEGQVGCKDVELLAKDQKIARLDAEAQRLAERVRALRAAEAKHMKAMAQQVRATEEAQRNLRTVGATLNEVLTERDAARDALRKIAAMVTPGSAPIGKRMAKVAAEHLAGAAGVQAEAA